ncbi:hypothetical protein LCDV1gp049 [Lymphocystis disease virus 1]|uniref:hypothetical protein n=1 Tax=Fish lymphocystis disease virus TaxID=36363 RepID=UPI0000161EEC|nr:hypothetical protein LCDV1gp049 [Lymphocystis disease virus 1]
MLGICFAIICTWSFTIKLIIDKAFYQDCHQKYIIFKTILSIIWKKLFTKPINIHQVTGRIKIIFHDGERFCHIFLKKCVSIVNIKGVDTTTDYTFELEPYFKWEQDYPTPITLNLTENLEINYVDETTYAVQNE